MNEEAGDKNGEDECTEMWIKETEVKEKGISRRKRLRRNDPPFYSCF